jgi:hypothetical protein
MSITTLNITIKGICICYLKNSVWKVLFPFDDCHKIKFSYKKNNETETTPVSLASSNGSIVFEVQNATTTAQALTSFSKFVDLTDSFAHSNGLVMQTNWSNIAVEMEMPNAEFFAAQEKGDFLLLDQTETNTIHDYGKIGTVVGATIKIDTGGSLSMKVNGNEQFPLNNWEEGATYTLKFNNDCDSMSPNDNDFEMLYDIIGDAQSSLLEFRLSDEGGGNKDGKPCSSVRAGIITNLP